MNRHASPRYDLDSSLQVAKAILDHGGEVTSQTMAGLLGYKGTENGAYLSRVAAAKSFGLIEGSATKLTVTLQARTILEPDFPEAAIEARVKAFLDVPLFAEVFRELEGRPLPDSPIGLRNLLKNRFGVGEKQAAMAASRLTESASQAGLFSVNPERMILPRKNASTGQRRPEPSVEEGVAQGVQTVRAAPAQTSSEFPTLIQGVLEMLPVAEKGWSEPELVFWVKFFEDALRVVYKLPRLGDLKGSQSAGPSGNSGSS